MTIGATDGNIIAPIITTHVVRKNPSAPGSVPGPASMPAIRSPVTTQPTAASPSRTAISGRELRPSGAAASRIPLIVALDAALRGLLRHLATELVISGLAVHALELQAKPVRAPRSPSDAVLGGEAEHGVLHRRVSAGGTREWLEADARLAHGSARCIAIREGDFRALDSEPLACEPGEVLEGAPFLTANDALNGLRLLARRRLFDYHPELPVPGGEIRGKQIAERERRASQVRPVQVALVDLEHKQSPALPIGPRGRAVDGAGTDQLAVAIRDVRPSDSPCHCEVSFRAAAMLPRGAKVLSGQT